MRDDYAPPFTELFKTFSDEDVSKYFHISPNQVIFLKKNVREGILPKILFEFLQTRIMIKRSRKMHKKYKEIYDLLDHRQYSLKLFMNVLYGYTGASYSGRMPCNDVADSVVETGKWIL